jgi:hypothetical protein
MNPSIPWRNACCRSIRATAVRARASNSGTASPVAGAPGVYQRGGLLVHILDQHEDSDSGAALRRVAGAVVVRDLPPPLLRDRLTRCARFLKRAKRGEGLDMADKLAAYLGLTLTAKRRKG